MTTELDRYGFSRTVVNAVAPVVEALKTQGISAARRALAASTIQWCEGIESMTLEPREADQYFTLLDLYLGEHGGEAQLGDDPQQLLVEGMTLHHLGESVGTDLSTLRRLAAKILGTDRE
jgi:hypothetical protein